MSHDALSPSESVMVHLLDSATGHIVQVWFLQAQAIIRIGRDPQQDVSISDPYVSRLHAELRSENGQWRLVSVGRNGVLIDGQRISETLAHNGLLFRLGAHGPTFRFLDTPPAVKDSMTMTAEYHERPPLQVDETKETKIGQEVREIADSDYFRELQERARRLRQQRKDGVGAPDSQPW
jgi:pSer/pThr/pTyr-binding forkhead associated (FHA) protein